MTIKIEYRTNRILLIFEKDYEKDRIIDLLVKEGLVTYENISTNTEI